MIERKDGIKYQGNLAVAVFRILKAVARLSLRYGMSVGAINEIARRAYLEAAEELLVEDNTKITCSRVCAMTGLYRKEVKRLEQLPQLGDTPTDDKYNRSARVISGWRRDPKFRTKSGKPAALKTEGPNGFDALVRQYSGDITPTAVKHELQRLDLVTVTTRNLLKLKTKAYIPTDESAAIQILGTDTSDLIETISQNIKSGDGEKLFQRKVCYLDIPEQHIDAFYSYAEKESQKLLENFDGWLAEKDMDYEGQNPVGARVGVGIYHIGPGQHSTNNFRASPNQKP